MSDDTFNNYSVLWSAGKITISLSFERRRGTWGRENEECQSAGAMQGQRSFDSIGLDRGNATDEQWS